MKEKQQDSVEERGFHGGGARLREEFSRVEISSVRNAEISSPDLGWNSGISEFLSSGNGGLWSSGIGEFW